MIKLENNDLTVEIAELGAQLHSIRRNDNRIEYLWQGDPASWKRQAPILFPFVGRAFVSAQVDVTEGEHVCEFVYHIFGKLHGFRMSYVDDIR